MPESFEPKPSDVEFDTEQLLDLARNQVLGAANEWRDAARSIDTKAHGRAVEQYVVGADNDFEAPFPSERIKIVQFTPITQRPHPLPEFSALYLYFPYDLPFRDGPGDQANTTIIFARIEANDGSTSRYVISRHRTLQYTDNEPIGVDMVRFELAVSYEGVENSFIAANDSFSDESQLQLLNKLVSVMHDGHSYRLTVQENDPPAQQTA